jgi:hypothetical protein
LSCFINFDGYLILDQMSKKNMPRKNKGQASTEYLVIMAIVLVVALVVVYLIGGFSGMGGSTMETESQQAWGTAAPFSITVLKQSGSILEMELRNSDINTLMITDISMDGSSVYSANVSFTSGQKRLLIASVQNCGAAGARFSHENVRITYNQGGITGKTETGSKPLIGRCS